MSFEAEISLTKSLKKHFGFDSFKGNQEIIIRNILSGHDTFVLMPTGGGKSLCYQLPALVSEGTAIIISPLIALMKNQVDAMRAFSEQDGVAHFLNSSLNKSAIAAVKEDVTSGKTKLLYVAPESLTKEENIEFLKQINISFYAIDEAHCISEWGHDFRPEYRRIKSIAEEIGPAPIIALTATATPKVQHDIQKNLGMPDATVFKSSFRRENLYYEIRPKTNATKDIIKYIKNNPGKSGIIYCLSRKKVEELAEILKVNGIRVLPYHAGMDPNTRSGNQDKFLMEEVDVIVATIAFGMGIDKPDVRFVMHYDIPKSLEGYYQETGRAGRDGGEGRCITFYNYKDIVKLEKFLQGKPVAEAEIGKQLLYETTTFAESSLCRVRLLLSYFGEKMDEDCGNCDNCLNPKESFEGKDYIVKVLKVITAVNHKYKTDHVSDILAGNATPNIKTYNHHQLELFGSGGDKDKVFWGAAIKHALINGLVNKNIENYGLLNVTEKGEEYLKNPYSIAMVEDQQFDNSDDVGLGATPGSGAGTVDSELFSILKDLRRKIAKKFDLPPFVIFQDPSLEDMCIQFPITIEEMQNISGVGVGKANKYGKEFADFIKKYVEERDIVRPMDMVVKSVVNKSGMKVFIIQSIDRKMSFEDIASTKNMTMDELLLEIESIVNSGTKLDIGYYLDLAMDEDKIDDIYDFFKEEAQTGTLDEALAELGEDDYTETEIRLVRIKFISDLGN
ncbi:MAG: DNA helicase RecQ [Bacteroidales bacterium]|nr:DNA helicase RecQ [Bacteroidales bacterium]